MNVIVTFSTAPKKTRTIQGPDPGDGTAGGDGGIVFFNNNF